MANNVAVMPAPKAQFFDNNGVVLAAGQLHTYAAGTTTPLATYSESTGTTVNANPVVLDAAGRCSVWLLAQAYHLVLADHNGVTVWDIDGVTAVSLDELLGNTTFASLTVTGNGEFGGDLTVDGKLTAASAEITGALAVDGNLTAATASVTGNATVGGSFGVTGDTTLSGDLAVTGDETVGGTLTVAGAATFTLDDTNTTFAGVTLADLITNAIGATDLAGSAILPSGISFDGTWIILQFGNVSGTNVKVAFGQGQGASSGFTITPPTGFNTTNFKASAWLNAVTVSAGNQLDNIAVSVSGATISVAASDNSGHNFTVTSNWSAICWLINQ